MVGNSLHERMSREAEAVCRWLKFHENLVAFELFLGHAIQALLGLLGSWEFRGCADTQIGRMSFGRGVSGMAASSVLESVRLTSPKAASMLLMRWKNQPVCRENLLLGTSIMWRGIRRQSDGLSAEICQRRKRTNDQPGTQHSLSVGLGGRRNRQRYAADFFPACLKECSLMKGWRSL